MRLYPGPVQPGCLLACLFLSFLPADSGRAVQLNLVPKERFSASWMKVMCFGARSAVPDAAPSLSCGQQEKSPLLREYTCPR